MEGDLRGGDWVIGAKDSRLGSPGQLFLFLSLSWGNSNLGRTICCSRLPECQVLSTVSRLSGQHVTYQNHKSEIPLEKAAENPLDNSSENPLDKFQSFGTYH